MTLTIHGLKSTPASVTTQRTRAVNVKAIRARRAASARPFILKGLHVRRDKSGSERSLTKKTPEEVRYAECHEKGIRAKTRTQKERGGHVPDKAKNPAESGPETYHTGSSGHGFLFRNLRFTGSREKWLTFYSVLCHIEIFREGAICLG